MAGTAVADALKHLRNNSRRNAGIFILSPPGELGTTGGKTARPTLGIGRDYHYKRPYKQGL